MLPPYLNIAFRVEARFTHTFWDRPMTTFRSSRMWQMSLCDGVTPRVSSRKSAARTEEYRRRRREDLRQVTIEIDRFVIGKLERNGYLEDSRDSAKLMAATKQIGKRLLALKIAC